MKPHLLPRRAKAAGKPKAPPLEPGARASALRGFALYSAAVALSIASLTAQADSTRAVEPKRPAAAHTYVALHMQQYTGMCGESYAVAGARRSAPLCLYEDDSAAVGPEINPAAAPAHAAALHGVP